ncbi:MAG: DUF5320 domain-containing protein [Vicinamibacterales bacterium]
MPGGDRTGPQGAGPQSGRGTGHCAGGAQPTPGRGMGGGFGRGWGFGARSGGGGAGRGWRNGLAGGGWRWWRRGSAIAAPVDQAEPVGGEAELKDRAAALEAELEAIKSRLSDTESGRK